ncbi:SsrA-binding protein SmpB [Pseudobacteriovorax antillogorgiicola]|uniref:SsrA-binding protein n=1 Tax=Pseudobacteriovorax antillogorgiicola TaxID=1513793 RepID=A0A1Y6CCY5_9BACT|nr:SsrA-binding protein SmpB [Pseudobacteriovorax antillogorgiicola]TCS48644.1 SsrA-binding protein [Pseudobacteriovorax antillogorgiicola]SMF55268.1 SsrA-binding protein [Pseudobacteriovorax antillogorgiicola]
MGIKIISKNRKAFHNFEIGEKLEAGIELQGTEVKALRATKVNLGEGWVDIDSGEAILKDCHIGHYEFGNRMNHDETRPRRLLLNKRELIKLSRSVNEKGFSIVPLKIYFKGRYIKVEIGLGKGKKHFDKRESSKKKDASREMARALKHKG